MVSTAFQQAVNVFQMQQVCHCASIWSGIPGCKWSALYRQWIGNIWKRDGLPAAKDQSALGYHQRVAHWLVPTCDLRAGLACLFGCRPRDRFWRRDGYRIEAAFTLQSARSSEEAVRMLMRPKRTLHAFCRIALCIAPMGFETMR